MTQGKAGCGAFRELLGDLAGLAGDEALDAAELRLRLQALIARFEPERDATQVSRHPPGTWTQIPGSGPIADDGARGSTGGSGRPSAHRGFCGPRRACGIVSLHSTGGACPAVRRVLAGFDRPAGSGRGARLLSRGDLDGPQACAPESIRARSPTACRYQAPEDRLIPLETLAARPEALHPRPQSACPCGGLSAAA